MSDDAIVILGVLSMGSLSAFLGIWGIVKENKLRKICTGQTLGVVSNIQKIGNLTLTRQGGNRHYFTEFTYMVNEVEYVKSSKIGTAGASFKQGMQVTVFYNPDNPNDYYVREDKITVSGYKIFTAAGILFMIAGVVVFSLEFI